jgi:cytochrome c556
MPERFDMKLTALPLALMLASAPVWAHENVSDPQVKARMMVMGDIRNSMGTLGGMAKGKIAFDAAQAAEAKAVLSKAAAQVLSAFEAPASDPVSEAAPAIWTDWDGFATKSVAMDAAIEALDTSSLDTIKAGLGPIGKTCGACHKAYRIKK